MLDVAVDQTAAVKGQRTGIAVGVEVVDVRAQEAQEAMWKSTAGSTNYRTC